MKKKIKQIIRRLPFFYTINNWFIRRSQFRELEAWEGAGRPAPPPHLVKQRVLRTYAQQYGLRVMVETGTYYGDMVEAMKRNFEKVYSIELSQELFLQAKNRFRADGNVELIFGDSGKELGKLVQKLNQPTLFWLDGHYSGAGTARAESDTPIFEELSYILDMPEKKHVIIIDDARCFGTDPAYPTIERLKQFLQQKRSDLEISIEADSIRVKCAEY